MGVDFGYARVSTVRQDLEAQQAFLRTEGISAERMFFDHGFTGKNLERDGLTTVLAAVRAGDKLVVPKMDRLARNVEDTLRIVRDLSDRGVAFQFNKTVYDPADPFSKLFMTFLAAIAEAEGGWISLRTQEAMARPAVRAKLKGRRPSLTPKQDAAVARHLDRGEFRAPAGAARYNTAGASVSRGAARHSRRQLGDGTTMSGEE